MQVGKSGESGFTIIEAMVAMLVLVVGLLGLMSLTVVANQTTSKNLGREGATTLSRDVLERALQLVPTYNAQLNFNDDPFNPGHVGETLRGLLPDKANSTKVDNDTFDIVRRGRTYRVEVHSCLEDQKTDGIWAHDSLFCDSVGLPVGTVQLPDLTGTTTGVQSGTRLAVSGILGSTNAFLNLPVVQTVVCNLLNTLLGSSGLSVSAVLGLSPGSPLLSAGAETVCRTVTTTTTTTASAALDPHPADLANLTAKVTWTANGRPQDITQSILITNPDA